MRRLFVEYTLNLKNITLQNYKELISNQNLLPGRKILQEDLDARFAAIRQTGTATVFELKKFSRRTFSALRSLCRMHLPSSGLSRLHFSPVT